MSKNAPLVTIVTRTHGERPQFVQGAAQSVMNQTYRPIEWLIVEDGPSVAPRVVESLAARDGITVRCLRNEKLGRSAAANRGLDEAAGSYVMFFDDDDELFPEHVQILADLLQHHPQAAGGYAAAYEVARSMGRNGRWKVGAERVHFLPVANSGILLKTNPFPIQAVLFRRDIVSHQRLDTNLDALEDWLFWQEIFLERKLVFTPEITSRFFVPAKPAEITRRTEAHRAAEHDFSIQAQAFYTERGLWQWGDIIENAEMELCSAADEAWQATPIT